MNKRSHPRHCEPVSQHWRGNPHPPAASFITEIVQIHHGQGEKRIATPVCGLVRNDRRNSVPPAD